MSDQSQSQDEPRAPVRKNRKGLPKTGSEFSTAGFWLGILSLAAGLAMVRKNKKSE
ncbi:LPXTG cell wall anchor domain-containing protein [Streptococcus cuniculi]|uniref:LPXTG cell wall anchor domain-containing protein n=1 Tax=Streptococcus cuniculi TaxID=1432788 RepID=UPI00244A88CB|nr:LPXTG cell wall anchor domain-containing protein [Streptococcus cuniculi]